MRERIERSLPFILVVVVLLISNALLSDTKKKEEPILHECGDYRYRLKEDGTAMITAYLNDEKWPFIPAELDGHAVTGIGDRAFSGNFITDVKIPNSITYTEGNPFAGGENSPRVIIAPDHPTLEIVDDVLFNKVEKTLVAYMCCHRYIAPIISYPHAHIQVCPLVDSPAGRKAVDILLCIVDRQRKGADFDVVIRVKFAICIVSGSQIPTELIL